MERRRSPVDLRSITPEQCTLEVLHAVLHNTPFFASLSAEAIRDVVPHFRQQDYRAGEVIHYAGDPARRLEIVAAGSVKLTRPTLEGRDVVLEILSPGSFFGSLELLGDDTYRETASAQTDCCILTATADQFRQVLERYPAAALASLDFVAARLRSAHDLIEQLSAYPIDRRIAATLLKLADSLGRPAPEGVLIDTPLTRQDLADMTGTTVETASRTMSKFRQAGVIQSGRRWVAILDRQRLAALAAGELID